MIALNTIFDHKNRIMRTIRFIDAHLDECLETKRLAGVACLSRHHFHRSFSYYIGDTVTGYVRNRRLTKAAGYLCTSTSNVTAAAYSFGYGTSEAFTKAFKRMFGMPPSVFQKHRFTSNERVSSTAIRLIPYLGEKAIENAGRMGFWERSRMGEQIRMGEVASIWISVFPDFHPGNNNSLEKSSFSSVRFGPLSYRIFFPDRYTEFHKMVSGEYAILYQDGEPVVYRRSEKIVPRRLYKQPIHLARLPIHMRSILIVPNTNPGTPCPIFH